MLLATSSRPRRKARATGGVQCHHPKEQRSCWAIPFWVEDVVMARFLGGTFRVADPRHANTTSAAAQGEEDAVGKKRNHKA